ncbi:TPA: alpha/beta hydrolase [Methanosarcina acetivorans]|uniref:Lipolytic enzyme n=2 Tax=Methanosarcina acetivorans TaxID=2214 RepID=Q8TMG8_METAC|nr:alpha/beta hydrolase [Methanosarcina acetivorans]AAM06069.1 lipolytic enzyme [Methanosarcina acetivorans C2A]HIH92794.1 alpha/beta hydrolase [Methanosarcina acetivorans]
MNPKTILPFILIFTILFSGCTDFYGEKPSKEFTEFSLDSSPVKYVSVNGIELGYREFGSGEPLLLIMGFGGKMDTWNKTFVWELAQDYRVITFDNRGVGYSSDSGENYSLELFASDTAGLLDALEISKANVFGTSMGASIAQELAINYPEKVDKLIFSSAFYSVNAPEASLLKTMFEYFAGNSAMSPLIREQADANLRWNGTYERLPEIKGRTLLLVGTEDEYTPPGISLAMAEQIPEAELIVFERVKHSGERYFPEKYSREILNFLKKRT